MSCLPFSEYYFFLGILFVPIVLFLVIVAPTWLTMYYRHKDKQDAGLSDNDLQKIDELNNLSDKMEERIKVLESILDSEHPNWREKQ